MMSYCFCFEICFYVFKDIVMICSNLMKLPSLIFNDITTFLEYCAVSFMCRHVSCVARETDSVSVEIEDCIERKDESS